MTGEDELSSRPDTATMLSSLKPFQRDTVDHAFERLWLADDSVDRFLVADEVGLGKTLVARGVASRLIDRLWPTGKPITIVYICTNAQIARQNLNRLRDLTGGAEQSFADRLTLLPKTMGLDDRQRVNVISFTPGTSFRLGSATGRVQERALLHWMLRHILDYGILSRTSAHKYFADQVCLEKFVDRLSWDSSQPVIGSALIADFEHYLTNTAGPFKHTMLADLIDELEHWKGKRTISEEMAQRQRIMIGALRIAMAQVSVARLEPDLVILDEFQRFKDLFPAADADSARLSDAQRLAQRVISSPGTKSLVLSATPYKMFTLPDEPEGDDHFRDFRETVKFLAGEKRSERVMVLLSEVRNGMLSRTTHGRETADKANRKASAELSRVISRTERLKATSKHDGMLVEKQLAPPKLHPSDLRSWMALRDITQFVSSHDAFEYWKSASYPVNLMDPSTYQFKARLLEAIEADATSCASVLADHRRGLLQWNDVQNYSALDAGNPKMRSLIDDFMGREAWKLAWLPPSMPYFEPVGPYAGEGAKTFTKRLVFSSWNVVPKAIATMVSYETERKLVDHSARRAKGERPAYEGRSSMSNIRFQWDLNNDQPGNLEMLALIHPSVVLARLGDPLEVARSTDRQLPLDREQLLAMVTDRIQVALDNLDLPISELGYTGPTSRPGAGKAWYGVAPYLLDIAAGVEDPGLLENSWTNTAEEDSSSRLGDHMAFAVEPVLSQLGPIPEDLARVLALAATSAPGICALRALSRATGQDVSLEDEALRQEALRASRGFVSLFNRPFITAAVRSAKSEAGVAGTYWQQVLEYCADGNLQAVLDEYTHTLIDSLGLSSDLPAERMRRLADQIASTATMRTAESVVHNFDVDHDHVVVTDQRMRNHIAARFGRTETSDSAAAREASVRDSFNSPFWPFVLASTSMGQEGLDFHTYSHSVVHWNLPSNPVDLEQREGRVHRYKGHAIRKNVAAAHGTAALDPSYADPWEAVFDAAESAEPPGSSLISPYWVYEGTAAIERYVPAMPLSREISQYRRLQRTLGAYRSVMGQSRQEDLIHLLGPGVEWPTIDIGPRPKRSETLSDPASAESE